MTIDVQNSAYFTHYCNDNVTSCDGWDLFTAEPTTSPTNAPSISPNSPDIYCSDGNSSASSATEFECFNQTYWCAGCAVYCNSWAGYVITCCFSCSYLLCSSDHVTFANYIALIRCLRTTINCNASYECTGHLSSVISGHSMKINVFQDSNLTLIAADGFNFYNGEINLYENARLNATCGVSNNTNGWPGACEYSKINGGTNSVISMPCSVTFIFLSSCSKCQSTVQVKFFRVFDCRC